MMKDLSNDTQVGVIVPTEPEAENLVAKFPVFTRFSLLKVVRLKDAFSEIFELETIPVGQGGTISQSKNFFSR